MRQSNYFSPLYRASLVMPTKETTTMSTFDLGVPEPFGPPPTPPPPPPPPPEPEPAPLGGGDLFTTPDLGGGDLFAAPDLGGGDLFAAPDLGGGDLFAAPDFGLDSSSGSPFDFGPAAELGATGDSAFFSGLANTATSTAGQFFESGSIPSDGGGFSANITTLVGGFDEGANVLDGQIPGIFQDIGRSAGILPDEITDIGRVVRSDAFGDAMNGIGNAGAFLNGTAESDSSNALGQLWDGGQAAATNHITGTLNPLGAGLEAGFALGEQFLGIEVDDRVQDFMPGASVGVGLESFA
ncbi:MAG: hypothetical protein AAF907_03155, partial [Planctomycetota bacterium]